MSDSVRRSGALLVATLVAATFALTGAQAATDDGRELLAADELRIGDLDVPIHERFLYRANNDDANPLVGGFIHGVQRVEGGTVLYYSVGQATGTGDRFTGNRAFENSTTPYGIGYAVDMRLLDTTDLVAYRPMAAGSETFAVLRSDLDGELGEFRVGMAVFPPLAEDVTTVSVIMGYGMAVGDVPVEDGPLEPVADETAPLLGEGWPAVPAASALSAADPDAFTTSLTRRTGDAGGATQTDESPEEVTATLDANVLFAFDSADLSAEAVGALADIAADIAQRGTGDVVVTGYTDSQGSSSYNQTLSEERAAAVVAELQGSAGDAVTFTAVGRGAADPVATNETEAGQQLNRRVTVVYQIEGDA